MTRRADPRTTRRPVRDVVAQGGELPAFTPVPRQYARHDGWTPERQRAFIEALADTGSVDAACKAVDMAQRGAYYLRRQPGAESFRAAWTAAVDLGVQRLEDAAMERALHGVEEQHFAQGELVRTRRRYNDRLLMFMLRSRAPERFAEGGARGLNAVGQMELRRKEKEWRAQWEAERAAAAPTPAEVRAAIDRKLAGLAAEHEARRAAAWAKLSEETRTAWDRFAALRDRDLVAMKADADTRRMLEQPRETINAEPPPGWRSKPPPRPPRTQWTVRDEGFEP